MKILYVEDNEDNIYMLKNRLSRVGFTVIVATDGTQGVNMATSEQPDLILMDLTRARHQRRRGDATAQGRSCHEEYSRYCPHGERYG
jgi:CheY-like chemotaxis protein